MRKRDVIVVAVLLLWVGVLWATTFKYLYTTETTYASSDYYGGGDADLTANSTWVYVAASDDIDLETNGYYGMWLTLEFKPGNASDDLWIAYYPSYDGTNFDDIEAWMHKFTNDGNEYQHTWRCFPAPPHGRIGLYVNGNTNYDYKITYHPVRGDGT